jgi:hypothetical protein
MRKIAVNVEPLGFEYILLLEQNTESALTVGVRKETDRVVVGLILCASSQSLVGQEITVLKQSVVRQIWSDDVEVLEHIPKWWTDEQKREKTW